MKNSSNEVSPYIAVSQIPDANRDLLKNLNEEEADALPPNSLFTAQNGQWYFKKRSFKLGFFIANYTDGTSHSALLKAIEMQDGKIIEETEKYLVAEFPGRAGNPKLVIDNTYGWCWGR